MKLIQRTPRTLTMRYVPWGTWLFIGSIAGMAIFPVMFWAEVRTFNCIRNLQKPTQGQCTITQSNRLGTHQRSWTLEQITGINVVDVGSNSHGRLYQIYLVTLKEQVPLTFFHPSTWTSTLQFNIDSIKSFLENPQTASLKFEEDDQFTTIVVALVGGGMMIAAGGVATLRLNKITGKMTLIKQGLFRKKTFECPLNQISDVFVVYGKTSSVMIQLKTGKMLRLHPAFSVSLTRVFLCQRCVTQILDFLHRETH